MTDTPEEWGPWIEYDGVAQPVPDGTLTDVFTMEDARLGFFSDPRPAEKWIWGKTDDETDIIRYRIRKPRGFTIIERCLENLPEREGEDA